MMTAAEHGLLSQMVTPCLDMYTYINMIYTYYIHIYQCYLPVLIMMTAAEHGLMFADGHAMPASPPARRGRRADGRGAGAAGAPPASAP